MTEKTTSGWRAFTGTVYVLFWVLAGAAALFAAAILFTGNIAGGLGTLVVAAVLAVMAWSTGRTFRSL